VIANGDITDSRTAAQALERSGADGVMIGRGAQGRPWLLAQVAADIYGTGMPDIPTGGALVDMIGEHYQAMLSFYGVDPGRRVARKHLGWYMDGLQTERGLRKEILTEPDHGKVPDLLRQLASSQQRKAA